MGPDNRKNTGAEFEKKIDSLFFGEDGAGKEPADDDYIEFMEVEAEENNNEE